MSYFEDPSVQDYQYIGNVISVYLSPPPGYESFEIQIGLTKLKVSGNGGSNPNRFRLDEITDVTGLTPGNPFVNQPGSVWHSTQVLPYNDGVTTHNIRVMIQDPITGGSSPFFAYLAFYDDTLGTTEIGGIGSSVRNVLTGGESPIPAPSLNPSFFTDPSVVNWRYFGDNMGVYGSPPPLFDAFAIDLTETKIKVCKNGLLNPNRYSTDDIVEVTDQSPGNGHPPISGTWHSTQVLTYLDGMTTHYIRVMIQIPVTGLPPFLVLCFYNDALGTTELGCINSNSKQGLPSPLSFAEFKGLYELETLSGEPPPGCREATVYWTDTKVKFVSNSGQICRTPHSSITLTPSAVTGIDWESNVLSMIILEVTRYFRYEFATSAVGYLQIRWYSDAGGTTQIALSTLDEEGTLSGVESGADADAPATTPAIINSEEFAGVYNVVSTGMNTPEGYSTFTVKISETKIKMTSNNGYTVRVQLADLALVYSGGIGEWKTNPFPVTVPDGTTTVVRYVRFYLKSSTSTQNAKIAVAWYATSEEDTLFVVSNVADRVDNSDVESIFIPTSPPTTIPPISDPRFRGTYEVEVISGTPPPGASESTVTIGLTKVKHIFNSGQISRTATSSFTMALSSIMDITWQSSLSAMTAMGITYYARYEFLVSGMTTSMRVRWFSDMSGTTQIALTNLVVSGSSGVESGADADAPLMTPALINSDEFEGVYTVISTSGDVPTGYATTIIRIGDTKIKMTSEDGYVTRFGLSDLTLSLSPTPGIDWQTPIIAVQVTNGSTTVTRYIRFQFARSTSSMETRLQIVWYLNSSGTTVLSTSDFAFRTDTSEVESMVGTTSPPTTVPPPPPTPPLINDPDYQGRYNFTGEVGSPSGYVNFNVVISMTKVKFTSSGGFISRFSGNELLLTSGGASGYWQTDTFPINVGGTLYFARIVLREPQGSGNASMAVLWYSSYEGLPMQQVYATDLEEAVDLVGAESATPAPEIPPSINEEQFQGTYTLTSSGSPPTGYSNFTVVVSESKVKFIPSPGSPLRFIGNEVVLRESNIPGVSWESPLLPVTVGGITYYARIEITEDSPTSLRVTWFSDNQGNNPIATTVEDLYEENDEAESDIPARSINQPDPGSTPTPTPIPCRPRPCGPRRKPCGPRRKPCAPESAHCEDDSNICGLTSFDWKLILIVIFLIVLIGVIRRRRC